MRIPACQLRKWWFAFEIVVLCCSLKGSVLASEEAYVSDYCERLQQEVQGKDPDNTGLGNDTASSIITAMYRGMSTVLAASRNFATSHRFTNGEHDEMQFEFDVPCDSNGVILVWAMHDDDGQALKAAPTTPNAHGSVASMTEVTTIPGIGLRSLHATEFSSLAATLSRTRSYSRDSAAVATGN